MRLRLKDYKFFIAILMCTSSIFSQIKISGFVTNEDKKTLQKVEIFDDYGNVLATTDIKGYYEFITNKKLLTVFFYLKEYELQEKNIKTEEKKTHYIVLNPFSEQLSEVEIKAKKHRVFELKRLKDVEGTAIYAGRKTEVVLVSESSANLAANNARQLYNQVAGLNIFENDDAGLQLNIGGRGLNPNRTSNFNTRQNSYDISADVLGYPESYYTPATEGVEEIQVIRGAASLQYGTQFGGVINFLMKKPNPNKTLETTSRSTLGSFNLFTNFTSIEGTSDKVSYYGYYNYKHGDGFRLNSKFDSKNVFAHLGYELNEFSKLEAEITYLKYLAQQAGGLTDRMFDENPFQSNRTRNWFTVNWFLYNLNFAHDFSENTKFTISFSGLNASRKTIGFRGNFRTSESNPVRDSDFPDPVKGEYEIRDLIVGDFKNWSVEVRFLSSCKLFGKESIFLAGSKYYKADNTSIQGAGSNEVDADFNFISTDDYISSDFILPNENFALFGESIYKFSDKFSLTPGFRFEYINTESKGTYTIVNRDAAGNPLPNTNNEFDDNEAKERAFILLGAGASYKPSDYVELYANVSQNYRSVTFSDIRTVNPTFIVDENIKDSKGLTADMGARGRWNEFISYDISAFGLFYNDRIGIVLESNGPNKGDRLRTNIGSAVIYGFESLINVNLLNLINIKNKKYSATIFSNLSVINSEYTQSDKAGVKGNKVEFIPDVNLKTGIQFGYKDFLLSIQYSYLTRQFTDATNSTSGTGSLREGIIGPVPAYKIVDLSASYTYKILKLEAGINNLLNETYFTRRATGYPGPGIIPSAPRNWYATLQIKF